MSASEPSLFPLAGLQAVANAHNEWQAVMLQLPLDPGDPVPALTTLFADPDIFAALAPLDCIVPIADPRALTESLLELLPSRRLIFCIPAAICFDEAVQEKCRRLAGWGYRIMVDGAIAIAASHTGTCALTFDCSSAIPPPRQLLALPGPHLARNIDSAQRLAQCRDAGFAWFSGDYALHCARENTALDDGTSRKRLLALLGLLARDADSRQLETLLKQDPALSYHLLRLVNSAAFAPSTPIHSFGPAIDLLGRRQLQRWLQLLLYARPHKDGTANALLPLAAVRAAQMEALCKVNGGDSDRQDVAFVAGVFSLLDELLGMPMKDIVSALCLHDDVAMALLERSGPLGRMLALVELHGVTQDALDSAGIDADIYWRSLLPAYQWAIRVSRNL